MGEYLGRDWHCKMNKKIGNRELKEMISFLNPRGFVTIYFHSYAKSEWPSNHTGQRYANCGLT